VLWQISEKEEDKKRAAQSKMLEKRELMLNELNYKRKVQNENEKGLERLRRINTQSLFN